MNGLSYKCMVTFKVICEWQQLHTHKWGGMLPLRLSTRVCARIQVMNCWRSNSGSYIIQRLYPTNNFSCLVPKHYSVNYSIKDCGHTGSPNIGSVLQCRHPTRLTIGCPLARLAPESRPETDGGIDPRARLVWVLCWAGGISSVESIIGVLVYCCMLMMRGSGVKE